MSIFALVLSLSMCVRIGFRYDVHVSLMDPQYKLLFNASKTISHCIQMICNLYYAYIEQLKVINTQNIKRFYESEVPFMTPFLISYCRIIYYSKKRKKCAWSEKLCFMFLCYFSNMQLIDLFLLYFCHYVNAV